VSELCSEPAQPTVFRVAVQRVQVADTVAEVPERVGGCVLEIGTLGPQLQANHLARIGHRLIGDLPIGGRGSDVLIRSGCFGDAHAGFLIEIGGCRSSADGKAVLCVDGLKPDGRSRTESAGSIHKMHNALSIRTVSRSSPPRGAIG
jgi:hypothetical protein